jgi:hypothetical protein
MWTCIAPVVFDRDIRLRVDGCDHALPVAYPSCHARRVAHPPIVSQPRSAFSPSRRPVLHRQHSGFGAAGGAELRQDLADVVPDRVGAERQPPSSVSSKNVPSAAAIRRQIASSSRSALSKSISAPKCSAARLLALHLERVAAQNSAPVPAHDPAEGIGVWRTLLPAKRVVSPFSLLERASRASCSFQLADPLAAD